MSAQRQKEQSGWQRKLTICYSKKTRHHFFTSRVENTEQRLKEHGFKYHTILFCKPRGGNYHWIDDRDVRATRFKGTFGELVKVKKDVLVFKEV